MTNLKVEIGQDNAADSNCLRQSKPVVAVCMEMTYHFLYRKVINFILNKTVFTP